MDRCRFLAKRIHRQEERRVLTWISNGEWVKPQLLRAICVIAASLLVSCIAVLFVGVSDDPAAMREAIRTVEQRVRVGEVVVSEQQTLPTTEAYFASLPPRTMSQDAVASLRSCYFFLLAVSLIGFVVFRPKVSALALAALPALALLLALHAWESALALVIAIVIYGLGTRLWKRPKSNQAAGE